MRGHRLYITSKRRREVYLKKLALIFVTICIIAGASVSLGCNFADAHEEERYYKSIEIQSGDSLWTIAEEYKCADESVNEYIAKLKEINRLFSDDIHEGQFLTVVY